MIMEIYNDKGKLENTINDLDYVVVMYASYMTLKYVNKANYRVTTTYNYGKGNTIRFKDLSNNYLIVFKNVTCDNITLNLRNVK